MPVILTLQIIWIDELFDDKIQIKCSQKEPDVVDDVLKMIYTIPTETLTEVY